MKYYPFASLASTRFLKTLRYARLTTTLGIVSLYVTLAVAAILYWLAPSVANVNQVLTFGVISSFALIGSGCLLALIIAFNKQSSKSTPV